MKLTIAAAGAMLLASAFAAPSQAAPMVTPGAALTQSAEGGQITEVQWRGHRRMRAYGWRRGPHYGWRRGHHYGWRHRGYRPHGWARRHWR